MNVFDIKSDANGKKAVVARPESCIECHACEASCPNGAIHFD
jgi:NAD-dependent dihydropyrimidine dehydrogenase PreA subunit